MSPPAGIPEEWYEWEKFGDSLIRDSLKSQDETAKYIIGLVSTVAALYTTLLTYFGLSGQSTLSLFLMIPLIFMLMSLGITLLIFRPELKSIDSTDPVGIKAAVIERSRTKYRFLSLGIILFVAGILAIPFVIGIGAVHEPEKVRFIVAEDKKTVLENISVTFEPGSVKTVPLVLRQQNQESYTVILANGDRAEIRKEWIQGIVYLQ